MWKTKEASRRTRAASHNILLVVLGCMVLAACQSRGPDITLDAPEGPPKRMVTQGQAKKIVVQNLTSCTHTIPR